MNYFLWLMVGIVQLCWGMHYDTSLTPYHQLTTIVPSDEIGYPSTRFGNILDPHTLQYRYLPVTTRISPYQSRQEIMLEAAHYFKSHNYPQKALGLYYTVAREIEEYHHMVADEKETVKQLRKVLHDEAITLSPQEKIDIQAYKEMYRFHKERAIYQKLPSLIARYAARNLIKDYPNIPEFQALKINELLLGRIIFSKDSRAAIQYLQDHPHQPLGTEELLTLESLSSCHPNAIPVLVNQYSNPAYSYYSPSRAAYYQSRIRRNYAYEFLSILKRYFETTSKAIAAPEVEKIMTGCFYTLLQAHPYQINLWSAPFLYKWLGTNSSSQSALALQKQSLPLDRSRFARTIPPSLHALPWSIPSNTLLIKLLNNNNFSTSTAHSLKRYAPTFIQYLYQKKYLPNDAAREVLKHYAPTNATAAWLVAKSYATQPTRDMQDHANTHYCLAVEQSSQADIVFTRALKGITKTISTVDYKAAKVLPPPAPFQRLLNLHNHLLSQPVLREGISTLEQLITDHLIRNESYALAFIKEYNASHPYSFWKKFWKKHPLTYLSKAIVEREENVSKTLSYLMKIYNQPNTGFITKEYCKDIITRYLGSISRPNKCIAFDPLKECYHWLLQPNQKLLLEELQKEIGEYDLNIGLETLTALKNTGFIEQLENKPHLFLRNQLLGDYYFCNAQNKKHDISFRINECRKAIESYKALQMLDHCKNSLAGFYTYLGGLYTEINLSAEACDAYEQAYGYQPCPELKVHEATAALNSFWLNGKKTSSRPDRNSSDISTYQIPQSSFDRYITIWKQAVKDKKIDDALKMKIISALCAMHFDSRCFLTCQRGLPENHKLAYEYAVLGSKLGIKTCETIKECLEKIGIEMKGKKRKGYLPAQRTPVIIIPSQTPLKASAEKVAFLASTQLCSLAADKERHDIVINFLDDLLAAETNNNHSFKNTGQLLEQCQFSHPILHAIKAYFLFNGLTKNNDYVQKESNPEDEQEAINIFVKASHHFSSSSSILVDEELFPRIGNNIITNLNNMLQNPNHPNLKKLEMYKRLMEAALKKNS